MKTSGLCKKEKLCSTRAIELLFGPGVADFSRLCYPLRAVARPSEVRKSDAPVAFLISVPKKRLHHAVDRVQMRRRIREAYRLNHNEFATNPSLRLDVAFVYVADKLIEYSAVEKAMRRILGALAEKYPAE
ncbi:MAG: ribonuclease P protein component [Bacteroidales bacterium]|nr:ribonuclease P protein component [Bacteroidales bacterium]